MTKQEFINNIYIAYAGKNGSLLPVFPSIAIAQAALESGWGKSTLASQYNNYFGIVANSSWKGKKIKLPGNSLTFRAYDNLQQSVEDYRQFLLENGRYKSGGVLDAKNYKEQAKALQNAGYAGENATKYADTLISIIESNNLYKFDNLQRPVETNDKSAGKSIILFAGVGIFLIVMFILIKN